MKKLFLSLSFIFMCLMALCQPDSTQVNPPTNWVDVISNFNTWFATLAGIAAVTVFIAAGINTLFKITKSIIKQIIAWGVAIILVTAGNLLNLGFVSNFPWLTTLAYGLAAGFVANGMFDVKTIQSILDFLKLKKVKPTP